MAIAIHNDTVSSRNTMFGMPDPQDSGCHFGTGKENRIKKTSKKQEVGELISCFLKNEEEETCRRSVYMNHGQ